MTEDLIAKRTKVQYLIDMIDEDRIDYLDEATDGQIEPGRDVSAEFRATLVARIADIDRRLALRPPQ